MKRLFLLPLISLALLTSCTSNEPKLSLGKYYLVQTSFYSEKTIAVLKENTVYKAEDLRSNGIHSFALCSIDKNAISISGLDAIDSDTRQISSPSYIITYETVSDNIISIGNKNVIGQFKEGLIYFDSNAVNYGGVYVTEVYAKNHDYKIIKL